jgi:2-polyprenyl-6-methoxyphenol hydroxylase-like FAD-dependent oxidoreductase
MLANQLARRSVRALIVDRHSGPAQQSRAMAVHARTLEIYAKLGIAGPALELGKRGEGANMWSGGGEERAFRRRHREEPEPVPLSSCWDRTNNERIPGERLRDLESDVQWNTELTAAPAGAG